MRSVALLAICTIAFSLSAIEVRAQETDTDDPNLRATVRAAILSDPRTAELGSAEIEAMVDALVEEASVQGVTSEAIEWRPEEDVPREEKAECGAMPAFFCALNKAFGFDGSDFVIPIGLGVSSALLLFVIGSLLLHRHGHHPVAGAIGAPSVPAPQMPPSQAPTSPNSPTSLYE